MLQYFLENLWRWKCGLSENEWGINTVNIDQTEWSNNFEQLRKHRLILGALRYGRLNAKKKCGYDRLSSMIKYLQKYQETGNDELLVDVANYCMLEFEEGTHPNKHFFTTDDGNHVKSISK